MPPIIEKDKCIGCHKCVDLCPVDVYGVQEKKGCPPVIRYPEECWHCHACVFDCPAKAIRLRVPAPLAMVFVDAPERKREN